LPLVEFSTPVQEKLGLPEAIFTRDAKDGKKRENNYSALGALARSYPNPRVHGSRKFADGEKFQA
jgi:hypothetical protein